MTPDRSGIVAETSAVILAGGRSSRMGRPKAGLPFRGGTLLSWQVEKLRGLGLRDIVIAGCGGAAEGVRAVGDVFPGRGPLSGIHAGLCAIACEQALVLAVDTPLIPGAFLCELIERHRGGVTAASVNGRPEPLIGVYSRSLLPLCEELLRGTDTSVHRLLRDAEAALVEFDGDPELLAGCNTPEEYEKLLCLDRAGADDQN